MRRREKMNFESDRLFIPIFSKLLSIEEKLNKDFAARVGFLDEQQIIGCELLAIDYGKLETEEERNLWITVAKKFTHLCIYPWNYESNLW